ncbi:MAG TPA: sugar phosphate isomerase/epimerase family protein, partial [Chitinophagaceae bacterium]|nr:sugar phosphate isomerase/epimerase family protein [Chitinophagaceae bacterium]
AEKIRCPYVRVFPNRFPEGQDKQETIKLIVDGLLELGDYGKKRSVTVLLETHGDVVWISDLEQIMIAARHSHVGLLWDVSNMWTITKEPVQEAYLRLKPYIRHTHLKDAVSLDGKLQYKLLGKGEVPIFEAISALEEDGYKGFYSFEWEKMWHPEIEEPEVALTDYSRVMKKFWNR